VKKSLAFSLSLLLATKVSAQSELATLLDALEYNGTLSAEQYQHLMSEQQGKKTETLAISKPREFVLS
tara:strand:- start:254 stop:457 length:204 start_codon:yes stop_codon:yes gene_type:complete